jgi:zinc transporter, ZIP family
LDKLIEAILYSSLAGIAGTGLGGVISIAIRKPGDKLPAMMMAFSGGLMMAVSCLDMIPEAVHAAGIAYAAIGILLGVVAIMAAHLLPGVGSHRGEAEIQKGSGGAKSSALLRTGVLISIGIALHDLPEGMAIGAGFSLPDYGVWISMLLMLHNIPEGVAMGVPLALSGVKRKRVLLYCVMAGTPSILGAVIGHLVGDISRYFIGMSIGFAAGAMILVTLRDLIPQSVKMRRSMGTWLSIGAGMAAGMCLVLFIPH